MNKKFKGMVISTPPIELSDRIHKMEEQIPAIEKYHEFVEYQKKPLWRARRKPSTRAIIAMNLTSTTRFTRG